MSDNPTNSEMEGVGMSLNSDGIAESGAGLKCECVGGSHGGYTCEGCR